MSINIPAETPDESTNPISVEEIRTPAPGDALHGIGQRHDGLLNVSRLCVGLRVISGIHWIALHVITSLLCAGLLILPLGRKALKRNTSEKQSALTNA